MSRMDSCPQTNPCGFFYSLFERGWFRCTDKEEEKEHAHTAGEGKTLPEKVCGKGVQVKKRKKAVSLFLALLMAVTLLPAGTVFAGAISGSAETETESVKQEASSVFGTSTEDTGPGENSTGKETEASGEESPSTAAPASVAMEPEKEETDAGTEKETAEAPETGSLDAGQTPETEAAPEEEETLSIVDDEGRYIWEDGYSGPSVEEFLSVSEKYGNQRVSVLTHEDYEAEEARKNNPRLRATEGGSTVTVDTTGVKHRYSSSGITNEFNVHTGNENYLGICCEPWLKAPHSYTTTCREVTDDLGNVLKAIFLGMEGQEGYSLWGVNTYGQGPTYGSFGDTFALAHACLGVAYANNTKGLSSSDAAYVRNVVKSMTDNVAHSSNEKYKKVLNKYKCFLADSDGTRQTIMWLERNTDKALLTVEKRSAVELDSKYDANTLGSRKLTGATFKMYRWNDETNQYHYITTATDNNNGTYTFEVDLVPADNDDNNWFLVKEEKAPGGYKLPYVFTGNDPNNSFLTNGDEVDYNIYRGRQFFLHKDKTWSYHQSEDASGLHAYKNKLSLSKGTVFYDTPNTITVSVLKVDATNTSKKLPGAKFELYGWNNSDNAYNLDFGAFTDNGDGTYSCKINYFDWPSNSYASRHWFLIKETQAPDGYEPSPLDSTYKYGSDESQGGTQFYVDKTGVVYTGSVSGGTYDYRNQGNTITIKNNPQNGLLKLKKTSSNPSCTNGNENYSLEGAVYTVYSDSALTKTAGTLTTDKNGISNTLTLKIGKYWVKEKTASKGYALDQQTHEVTITSDHVNTAYVLSVEETPQLDPVGVLISKVDADTGETVPEGRGTLGGAEFEVKYYDTLDASADPASKGKKPLKTWTIKTDEDGYAELKSTYLVKGDDFYLDPTGTPALPLGVVTIKETEAPEGYHKNEELFIIPIPADGTTQGISTYQYPVVKEKVLQLILHKVQSGTDKAIPGAVFEHTCPDGTKEKAATGTDGSLSFKGLTYGTHTVKEVSVPEGYSLNTNEIRFTVAEDNTITFQSSAVETDTNGAIRLTVNKEGNPEAVVEDPPAPYKVRVIKKNNEGKTLKYAKFTLYAEAECKTVVSELRTDENGILTMENLIPGRHYYLKETEAPPGYRIPEEGRNYDIYVYSVPVDGIFDFSINGTTYHADQTDSSKPVYLSGSKADRIICIGVINPVGLKLPDTGSSLTLALVLAGAGIMLSVLFFTGKGRNQKTDK